MLSLRCFLSRRGTRRVQICCSCNGTCLAWQGSPFQYLRSAREMNASPPLLLSNQKAPNQNKTRIKNQSHWLISVVFLMYYVFFSEDVVVLSLGPNEGCHFFCNWKNEAPRLHPGSNRQVWNTAGMLYRGKVWSVWLGTMFGPSQLARHFTDLEGSPELLYMIMQKKLGFTKMCIQFRLQKGPDTWTWSNYSNTTWAPKR